MKSLIPLIIGLSIPVTLFVLFDRLTAHPIRWLARGRMLLIAIESALEREVSVEAALVELAEKHDPELGPKFHALAAWLKEGLPLHEALDLTPGLLPRPVQSLLMQGSRTGTLTTLLPVGRDVMGSLAAPLLPSGRNLIAPLAATVCLIGLTAMFSIFIVPRLTMIFADLGAGTEIELPPALLLLSRHQDLWLAAHCLMLGLMIAANLFLLGGPAVAHWTQLRFPRLTEVVHRHLPWQRLDQRRRFGLALTRLLDAAVPEEQALRLAGDFADDCSHQAGVDRAITRLRDGERLTEAIREIAPDPDLCFRLEATSLSGGGFRSAIAGWEEAQQARARFREAAAMDLVYTFFLAYNAACIGITGVAFFASEIKRINTLVAW